MVIVTQNHHLCYFEICVLEYLHVFQVPLALFQSKYLHGKWGNIVVWLSLILGQPIAILAYFHDYYVMHATQLMPANHTA